MYPSQKSRRYTEDDDENIYLKETRERQVDEGVLRGWEDGIMDGYEEGFPESDYGEDEFSWADEQQPEEVV